MTTPKDARAIALRHPKAARVGWLLACDAPENLEKGQRLLARLPDADQLRAMNYRNWCLEDRRVVAHDPTRTHP